MPASDDQRICEEFARCSTFLGTARAVGRSIDYVKKVLQRHGKAILPNRADWVRSKRLFNDEQERTIRARYEGGASLHQLCNEFEANHGTIIGAIVRAGGTYKRVLPTVGLERAREFHSLRESGCSVAAIARRFSTTKVAVRRAIQRFQWHAQNVDFSQANGLAMEQNPHWKGGRFFNRHTGYTMVKISKGDMCWPMAKGNGYILEHRLVMARKMGRLLLSTETVHHINGDRSDNRPDNLQLRQGQHGSHIVMCCRDCGSQNVGPAPIAEPTSGDLPRDGVVTH